MPSTSKRSAKIVCRGGSVWVSSREFWRLVRDDIVEFSSEPPLTGRFRGAAADFLVTVNHTILNLTCPEHRAAVLVSKRQMKKRKTISA